MIAFLEHRTQSFYWCASAVSILVLGSVDYATGFELSFDFFYVAPVAIAGWFLGRVPGLTIAACCTLVWLAADVASGHEYSHPFFYFWNALIRFGTFSIATLLATALRRAIDLARDAARIDHVSGAVNARSFYEWAKAELDRLSRYKSTFTLAYIALDNFKSVNDKFGHSIGDQVLRAVADTMRRQSRAADVVARVGGDEFAMLYPETGVSAAHAAAAKMQAALLETMAKNDWPVTISMGVVTYLSAPASVDETTKLADTLMYKVKSAGKNAVQFAVYPSQESSTPV
jgi:diguanylate cyclase (GGDEF)-like protein